MSSFEEVIRKATRAVDVAIPEDLVVLVSCSEENKELHSALAQTPLLPDFKDLVCRQLLHQQLSINGLHHAEDSNMHEKVPLCLRQRFSIPLAC